MAQCITCEKQLSFLENMKAMLTYKRCGNCEAQFKNYQQQSLATIDQIYASGGLTSQAEQDMYLYLSRIKLPQDLGEPVVARLRYLRPLAEIQWGNVPVIGTDIHLDSDEHAHFDWPSTYFKPTKVEKQIVGRMIGTNKKLYFLSSSGRDSTTIDWNNVSKVDSCIHLLLAQNGNRVQVPAIHITVSKGSGGGPYQIQDSYYSKIFIDALVRLWKRQIVLYKENNVQGSIPQHVKNAVFKRDGGKCVQCGYDGEYIEYDHIIPRSKSGPNTVENVQLLCRKCNLQKGNRL